MTLLTSLTRGETNPGGEARGGPEGKTWKKVGEIRTWGGGGEDGRMRGKIKRDKELLLTCSIR